MRKRIAATSFLIVFIFTALMYYAAITHAQGPWTLTVYSDYGSPSPGVGPHTYNDNDSVTCTVTSPFFDGVHTYTCTGWSGTGNFASGGSGTTAGPFTMTEDSNITWNWQLTQWSLTVASAHGSPSPGVGPHMYNDGGSVNCSVSSPVVEGGISYTCMGWTGAGSVPLSGSGNSITFNMSQDSSITWNWQVTQRTLTVTSAHDNPNPGIGVHTYNDGSSVTCSVTSPVTEGGVSYTCTGWTGTGDVPSSGSNTSVAFTISQDSTVTWIWQITQWTLNVTSAHDSPSPTVGNHLYNDGSSVTCSVTSPVTEGSTVWTCTGWVGTGSVPPSGSSTSTSFTITQNSTITWNWQGTPVQRKLTVVSVRDSSSPTVGDHLYDDGSSVVCSVISPVVQGGVSYTCVGWFGTGSVPSSGIGTSVDFVISQNSTITWIWQVTQWTLTVTSAHGNPNPAVGNNLYSDGSSVTCSVSSPVVEGGVSYTCTGWTGTGDVPSSGSDTFVSFTISQNSSITWNWQVTQWTLTVASVRDSSSPTVGDHLYDDGSSVVCSVISPVVQGGVSYTCVGWFGTGSVPSSGIGTSVDFVISQNSTITWIWQAVQRKLTVVSVHGSPNPGVGDHSYNDGRSVTCSVTSPVVESGVAYACVGWFGTGSVPASGTGVSVTFTISQDSSITWIWQVVQRKLTVVSAHDSPNPSVGDSFYNDGSSVTCSVASPVTEGVTVYTCTGWTGTGSVPSSGSGVSVTFTISQDSTITWNWHGNAVQRKSTVTSAHGNPSPAVGDHLYDDGDSVTCSITSPVTEGGVTYSCIGWSGTGSVPSSGSSTFVSFTISQNSSITWNWQVAQWTLTVASAHGNPNPAVGNNLYSDGSSVTCSVTSPVVEADISYTCVGWFGTGSVPPSGSSFSVTFSITENSSITWNWTVTLPVQLTLTVTSVHGNPSPGVGDSFHDDGSSVACSVSSPVVEGGVSYTCTGWTGTGDVPSSGSDTFVSFTISQNSSITWNWQVTQRTLIVTSAHDSPNPSVGDHSYNDGSSVTCSVTSPMTEAGQVWTCTGWVGTGSVPVSGDGFSVTFSINENSSITWNWEAQRVPAIESCDDAGVQRDVFGLDGTVYVFGSGFGMSQTYNVYIVYDTAWFDGANITGIVQEVTASSDSSGNISLTAVWNKPLTPGVYDILVDVNGNGKYDAGVDALYSSKVIAAAGNSLMTEYLFGTVLGLTGCFAALGAFRMYKRRRRRSVF